MPAVLAVLALVFVAGLGAGAYFYFGYVRPLSRARATMERFVSEVRKHRLPASVACPKLFQTWLIVDAMADPEVQSCQVRSYRFHELDPTAGSSLNPRLELSCARIPGQPRKVIISLLGIDSGLCGPKNQGFVLASVAVEHADGSERTVFRLPDSAHVKLFGR